MTKPQIWVAVFLGLFLILFILSRVTDEGIFNKTPQRTTGMTEQAPQTSNQPITAEEMISSFGCTTCHGNDLGGTDKGPPLANLKKYWSRDDLINYLRNPSSFMDSERFVQYQQKYKSYIMPSFNNINIKDLGKIADYLLTK